MSVYEDINHRCQKIVSLSPRARQKLDSEQWRTSFDDPDIDLEPIQQVLFINMLSDLTNIGIDTVTSADQIYQNSYDLDQFLDILTWVLPNTLYPKLRHDMGLRAGIERILHGGISNASTIHDYLGFLGGVDGGDAYIPDVSEACIFAMTCLTSNATFSDYLANMIETVRDQVDSDTYLVNDPQTYHEAITNAVIAIAQVKDQLIHLLSDEDKVKLERRVYFASREIMKPDQLNSLGWLLTTDRSALPEDSQAIYDRKKVILTAGLKITPLYFTSRHMTPDLVDMIGIVTYLTGVEGMSIQDSVALINKTFSTHLSIKES